MLMYISIDRAPNSWKLASYCNLFPRVHPCAQKFNVFTVRERERESVDRRKPRKARNLTHNQGFTAPLAEANEVSGRRLADQAKSKKRHTQDSEELLDLDTGCVLTQVQ